MKIAELKKRQIGDIGFVNTYLIDATEVEHLLKIPRPTCYDHSKKMKTKI